MYPDLKGKSPDPLPPNGVLISLINEKSGSLMFKGPLICRLYAWASHLPYLILSFLHHVNGCAFPSYSTLQSSWEDCNG